MTSTFRAPKDDNIFRDARVDLHRRLSAPRHMQVLDSQLDVDMQALERKREELLALSSKYDLTALSGQDGVSNVAPLRRNQDQQQPFDDFEYALAYLAKETRRANRFIRPMTVFVVAFEELLSLPAVHGGDAYQSSLAFISVLVQKCLDADLDIVGLYGTDRILLALPETHAAKAVFVAEGIKESFRKTPFEFQNTRILLRPSIGIASLPLHGREWMELVARADLAADAVVAAGGGHAFGPQ